MIGGWEPSEARARQRSRWFCKVRERVRSAARYAGRSVLSWGAEGEGEVAVDVEAVAVVPAAAPAVGGVAREEASKSGPRVRLRAFSIVRQAVLEASASRFEAVGRELVEAEAEPDVVVGGERMTEARRRGRRGL